MTGRVKYLDGDSRKLYTSGMEKIEVEDCYCDEMSEQKLVTTEIRLVGQKVLVEDIKTRICLKCGTMYFDGPTILKLVRELKDKLKKEKS